MKSCTTLAPSEFLQNCGGHTGFSVGVRQSDGTNARVRNVSGGGLNQLSQGWLTFPRPMSVIVGRRQEKRWGVIFKCLTTQAVHLDLLRNMDTYAYLMALRRFIARRGRPAELWSDQGTNFKGGGRELREAFASMTPALQERLARQQIKFCFNPPAAPHFGGVRERDVRSVKSALYSCVGAQPLPEEVLLTVLRG